MRDVHTVREHATFEVGPTLSKEDVADLESVAGTVLKRKDSGLAASRYVGVITTRRGKVVEILPKIDLGGELDPGDEKTRRLFLRMLRCWRRLGGTKTLPESGIRAMSRFPMLEIFFHQFLVNLNILARGGLARRYVSVEENLPYLRGRILFHEQTLANSANLARFYVTHDELSINRPANRLIQNTLTKIKPRVQTAENRQLLRQLMVTFAEVPAAANPHADWQKHHVDRSMQHYGPVMQWVGLFLFNQGLTAFAGRHTNLSLLFPMEQVFEDFVTHSFRRYQGDFTVVPKAPWKSLARIGGNDAFAMEPDISLKAGGRVVFILDAKWKHIDAHSGDSKHGIEQADMYQLYTYGKCYECDAVALVYPRSEKFSTELHYKFFDDLNLVCLPFDVANPQMSVQRSLAVLRGKYE